MPQDEVLVFLHGLYMLAAGALDSCRWESDLIWAWVLCELKKEKAPSLHCSVSQGLAHLALWRPCLEMGSDK